MPCRTVIVLHEESIGRQEKPSFDPSDRFIRVQIRDEPICNPRFHAPFRQEMDHGCARTVGCRRGAFLGAHDREGIRRDSGND